MSPPRTTHHTDLAEMQTKLANELPVSLTALVGGPGSEEFNTAYQRLEAWIMTNKGEYGLRILMTMSDGRTVVDTAKGFDKNTQADKKNPVNENHNTRPVIKRAINVDGPQFELKVSNSTGEEELRCSLRMGPSMEQPVGVVSISSKIPDKKDAPAYQNLKTLSNKKIIF
jgi:hypothetical protein